MTLARTQYLPSLLIAIDIGAALIWALDSDWRRTTYWLAAAVLTATVTF